MKVKVTKKHQQEGTPSDGDQCAIALALADLGFDDVNVDGGEITLSLTIDTPKAAQKFIEQFDMDEPAAYSYAKGEKDPQYKRDMKKWNEAHAKVKDFIFNLPLPKNLEKALRTK